MDADVLSGSIDRASLTPIVRNALGNETAEITEWQIQPMAGGVMGPRTGESAVHRICGTSRVEDHCLPWSVVLKVCRGLRPDQPIVEWNCEALAYESGLLDDLPGDFAAPRCFGVDRRPDDLNWIWLEDVADLCGPRWPLERYGLAARHLGQFNGAYLVDRPLPAFPWINTLRWSADSRTTSWLRSAFEQYPAALRTPLGRRISPPTVEQGILRLKSYLPMLLDALGLAPRTLCHGDAFRRNLFAREAADGREQTVAIDWAMLEIAPLGAEIGALVGNEPLLGRTSPFEDWELVEPVFEGYTSGLRDVGWRGDLHVPRLIYLGALAVRACGQHALQIPRLPDDDSLARYAQARGETADQLADRIIRAGRLGARAADEARELLSLVDLSEAR